MVLELHGSLLRRRWHGLYVIYAQLSVWRYAECCKLFYEPRSSQRSRNFWPLVESLDITAILRPRAYNLSASSPCVGQPHALACRKTH